MLGHFGIQAIDKVVFTFHMPLFFLISGYFINDNVSIWEFVKRKMSRLLVPYYVTGVSICFLLILADIVRGLWNQIPIDFWNIIIAILYGSCLDVTKQIHGIGAIWFLWALFWSTLMESMVKYGDSLYQTKKHVFAVLMALFVGMLCAMTPTEIWKKYSLHCFIVVCALMILVMIVGREINGAKRWLPLGFINLQPSELLKIFWILYFSSYVSRKIESISTTTKGFIKPLAFIGVMAVLLLVQHDMGSLVVVSCITYSLTFIAGAGFIKYGVVIMVALLLAFLRECMKKDVKMLRRVKLMLRVVRQQKYWLLIIKYIWKIRSIFASILIRLFFNGFDYVG